jgi:hypothetical protein
VTVASLPLLETTVSFALPESRKKMASATPPCEKKTCPDFTRTILCATPAAFKKRAGSNKVLLVPGIWPLRTLTAPTLGAVGSAIPYKINYQYPMGVSLS